MATSSDFPSTQETIYFLEDYPSSILVNLISNIWWFQRRI